MINHGPVDVVVLAAGEPRFDGGVLAELERQVASGTIRVLDAMILFKDEEGNCWGLDMENLPPEEVSRPGFHRYRDARSFRFRGCRHAVRRHGARLGGGGPGDRAYLGAGTGECALPSGRGCGVELPRAGNGCR